MSDCIQLIADFVSPHFCIFSERLAFKLLQETCLTGQLNAKKIFSDAQRWALAGRRSSELVLWAVTLWSASRRQRGAGYLLNLLCTIFLESVLISRRRLFHCPEKVRITFLLPTGGAKTPWDA
jgi:hypothetical protein